MSFFSTTEDELVERICRLVLHEWWGGDTSAAGTITTFVDSARPEADDYFNNFDAWVYFRSGAAKGSEGLISDWVKTTTTGTYSPASVVAPGTGALYSIHKNFRWPDIRSAINTAIDLAGRQTLIEKVDESSLVLQSDTFEYPVPTGFTHIYRMTMADSGGEFNFLPIPPDHYKIVRGTAIPRIHFFNDEDNLNLGEGHSIGNWWARCRLSDGRAVRIEGFQKQLHLADPTDICYLNPMFIVAQAGAILHASMIRRAENEPDNHAVQYQVWQRIADQELKKSKTQYPPNCKKVEI